MKLSWAESIFYSWPCLAKLSPLEGKLSLIIATEKARKRMKKMHFYDSLEKQSKIHERADCGIDERNP